MFKGLLSVFIFVTTLATSTETGNASWYGESWNGRKTASGEIFDSSKNTCAHNKLKMGTIIRVTNIENGKSVTCKVNDKGGFAKYGRVLDMSKGSFSVIGNINKGVIRVKIEIIK